MRYDYVDIGTSDFETSLDVRHADQTVLLVEPLFSYLANLPNGKGIFKANVAVSDRAGFNKIYYVTERDIQQYGLPGWVRGCNSLGKKHVTVVTLLEERNLPDAVISTQETRVITFADLVKLYDMSAIGQLKVDTEGHDHVILPGVITRLQAHTLQIDTIIFEYLPAFHNTDRLDSLAEQLVGLGYTAIRYGDNMTLTKA